ncbi:hypothetical protein [Noviherbaspirillum humi]|nr:hypothetical protein [Noviherbaspirillum humi]
MSQYFRIFNSSKLQFLEPSRFPCSGNFPSMLTGSKHLSAGLALLTIGSANSAWLAHKQLGHYSQQWLGCWSGDMVQLVGDYEQADVWDELNRNGQDISLQVLTMMCELSADLKDEILSIYADDLVSLGNLARLEHSQVLAFVQNKFGRNWLDKYHRKLAESYQ